MKYLRNWLLALGLFLLMNLALPQEALALKEVTPPVPEIPTIPLVPELLKISGNSRLIDTQNDRIDPKTGVKTTVAFRYARVTANAYNQRGAVWLNDPIDFNKDAFILLYVYMQAGGTGDGLAIALKERVDANDNREYGTNWDGSLGVYGPTEYLGGRVEPLSSATKGALANSFVIELDNYHNDPFDAQTTGRSHIAYNYPNLVSSYQVARSQPEPDPLAPLRRRYFSRLNHQNLQSHISPIGTFANGYWMPFFLEYTKATNTLTYQYGNENNLLTGAYQGKVDNFINGNDGTKEKFRSGKLYLGVLGATGKDEGAVQETAFRIAQIPDALNLSIRQLIYMDDSAVPFFDSDKLKNSTGPGPEISLTRTDASFKYVSTITYGQNSAYSSIGQSVFKIAKQPTLAYDLKSFKWNNKAIEVTDDLENNQIIIRTPEPFNRGQVGTLEYRAKPDFPELRSGNSTVVPSLNMTGAIYGSAGIPKNQNNQDLRFNINENLELTVHGMVAKVEGAKQTTIYDTDHLDMKPYVFDKPDPTLSLKTSFTIRPESSYNSLTASYLYVSLRDDLVVDLNSFKVNGQAVPRNQISIDASKQIDIEGDYEITKSKSLEIEYRAVAKGYQVNKNINKDFLLTTFFELSGDVGDVVFEAEVPVKFETKPQIQFAQGKVLKDLAASTATTYSVKKPRSISGSDTDLNSTDLRYFIKDLGTQVPTGEYQPEENLAVLAEHQNRATLDSGNAQNFTLDLAGLNKGTDEVRYYALFARDNEGNFSNVVYLKVLLASDTLTLDRVPNLKFENKQGLGIQKLAFPKDDNQLIFPLTNFAVENQLGAFDGFANNDGQIILRDTRLDRSQKWTLNMEIIDIKSTVTKKSLNDRAGVILQLGLPNQVKKYLLNANYRENSVKVLTSQGEQNVGKQLLLLASDGTNSGRPDVRTLVLDPELTHLQLIKNSQAGYFDQGTYQKGPYQMIIRYTLAIEK